MILGGWTWAPITFLLVDHSSPYPFSPNAGGIAVDHMSFWFLISRLHPFRRYSRSKFEVVRSRSKFGMFRPPTFWREGPTILGPRLSNGRTFDHVAKFRGDRPTELGYLVAKKRKQTSAVKHKTAGNYRSGRSNKKTENMCTIFVFNKCVIFVLHNATTTYSIAALLHAC